jgi:hypothetical protein
MENLKVDLDMDGRIRNVKEAEFKGVKRINLVLDKGSFKHEFYQKWDLSLSVERLSASCKGICTTQLIKSSEQRYCRCNVCCCKCT